MRAVAESVGVKRKHQSEPMTVGSFLAWSYPEPNTGCWLWGKAITPHGYGVIRIGPRTLRAHRVVYELHTGKRLPRGMDVCHHCDVRCCVNPEHLFAGTRKDNMRDCANKGRINLPNLKGEACPAAKLAAAQVISIRNDPRSQRKIAAEYGVDKGTVASIKNGKTWRSL